ncbi:hypothetical protein AMTR_s00080p00118990 [Amborella trichopoda]|uniref:Uncharacterized protein n=1 Tax=Amborella trichopoda TaxID=13333 RepID=W1P4W9_AMBTC|nr:hypothetical protein AMTR_s00080p00118990 [Amborella trichopoda]
MSFVPHLTRLPPHEPRATVEQSPGNAYSTWVARDRIWEHVRNYKLMVCELDDTSMSFNLRTKTIIYLSTLPTSWDPFSASPEARETSLSMGDMAFSLKAKEKNRAACVEGPITSVHMVNSRTSLDLNFKYHMGYPSRHGYLSRRKENGRQVCNVYDIRVLGTPSNFAVVLLLPILKQTPEASGQYQCQYEQREGLHGSRRHGHS